MFCRTNNLFGSGNPCNGMDSYFHLESGLPGPKKLKKTVKRPNFVPKIVEITRFKIGI